MNSSDMMRKIDKILETSGIGILATVGKDLKPHMRWMNLAILTGRPGALYAVTSPHFSKINDIKEHPDIEWLIQTCALDEVVKIQGKINILNNPSIRAEVLESIGSKLRMFSKINENPSECVILETIIENATYFHTMKLVREAVSFLER